MVKNNILSEIGKRKTQVVIALGLIGFISIFFYINYESAKRAEIEKIYEEKVNKLLFKKTLTRNVNFIKNEWPEKLEVNGSIYEISYTFNKKLTSYIKRLLRRYNTDYSSVVVIDNKSGKILSAIDYSGITKEFGSSVTFSTTHPAASLFKVVTAATLYSSKKVNLNSKFTYRGKGTTLYKYQLKEKKSRWKNSITFKKAFAYSNNVIFGKAAQKYLNPQSLSSMARLFGFNREIMSDLLIGKSVFLTPDGKYNIAEKASGFNRTTLIGPVHGAVLSLIVANKGILKLPKVVGSVVNVETRKEINIDENDEKVLDRSSAEMLHDSMVEVIKRGSARKQFYRINRRIKKEIVIGGKTGRISGGFPYGMRDWFSGFSYLKSNNEGISICVMNINGDKWYVRSGYLAKKIIEYYFKNILVNNKSKNQKIAQNISKIKGES